MSAYTPIMVMSVGIDFGKGKIPVGRLARRDRRIYFSYEPSFLGRGLDISPFALPVKAGVTATDPSLFGGLPGVCNDSLPDGWGRLLFDRFMRSRGISVSQISPLDRLASVGTGGIGALVYEPEAAVPIEYGHVDLDDVAFQVRQFLQGSPIEVINRLLALNGSSAGARPKALIGVSKDFLRIACGPEPPEPGFEPWLVKFPNTDDGIDAGSVEYVYALMAVRAGIRMPEVHLFPARTGPGYFATKRFDRDGSSRLHMHSASGLLHADFRNPSLDYQDLIKLTSILTRDVREVEHMYRLAVFNVLAHNRDDHGKNFSFLMDAQGRWTLSPAYDLTFSSGPGGEQSTMVMGEGKSPSVEHLLELGLGANLPKPDIVRIIEQTREALAMWPELARRHGVENSNISLVGKQICP